MTRRGSGTAREPEVGDPRLAAVIHEDVGGLEVAVHESLRMSGSETAARRDQHA